MDRLPVFAVGLLLILTAGGVVWCAGHGAGDAARTASDLSVSSSTVNTPMPTLRPTDTPTAADSSLMSLEVTPTVEASSSVVVAEENGSEMEDPVVQESWERALGGPSWMEDPSTMVTPLPSPTPTPVVHVVEEGDNLRRIATQYDRTVEAIAEANGIDEDFLLQIGQELIIPPPQGGRAQDEVEEATTPATRVHTVKAGDTLGSIAVLYDVSTEEIAEANGLRLDTTLQIDQELVIPLSEESEGDDAEISETPTPRATEKATATPTETPALVVHTVEAGDTLGSIAVLYDVETEAIVEANDLSSNTLLQLDQELIIPGIAPTPTPTSTSTPSPTLKTTATPSPTPTRGDTATPTLAYRQPQLLAPPHASMVEGKEEDVVLNWTSVGVLADDEWYMLRLWPAEEDTPVVEWTKATSWRVPPEMYPGKGVLNALHWQVTVVVRPREEAEGEPISLPSERYTFIWR
ncbi:MAG: LysM peptidoglycan-binding domain-containing protein [Anaerolineae bacterium]